MAGDVDAGAPADLMRFGVLADIHANRHALDAVLAFLDAQELDGYLCAGDLVGYGPAPNECVRGGSALPGHCVAGNHDLIALGRLDDGGCDQRARKSLAWTRTVLADDVFELLEALPRGESVDRVALHHGSPSDPREYVRTEARALSCLNELGPEATTLILGHTHEPLAVGRRRGRLVQGTTGSVRLEPDEPILLNPGSVGQSRSRDPRARVMVLDLAERRASFHAVEYDVAACRDALREQGLPPDSCHPWRSRWSAAVHTLTRGHHG